jgi:hypothetical protein
MTWTETIIKILVIFLIAITCFIAGRLSMPEYISPNAYEIRNGTKNSEGYYVYEVYRAERPKGILIVEDDIEYGFFINTNVYK